MKSMDSEILKKMSRKVCTFIKRKFTQDVDKIYTWCPARETKTVFFAKVFCLKGENTKRQRWEADTTPDETRVVFTWLASIDSLNMSSKWSLFDCCLTSCHGSDVHLIRRKMRWGSQDSWKNGRRCNIHWSLEMSRVMRKVMLVSIQVMHVRRRVRWTQSWRTRVRGKDIRGSKISSISVAVPSISRVKSCVRSVNIGVMTRGWHDEWRSMRIDMLLLRREVMLRIGRKELLLLLLVLQVRDVVVSGIVVLMKEREKHREKMLRNDMSE